MTMKTNYWFNRNRLLSGLRFGTALLLVLSVLFISASSSQAEPAQTYHGTLTGGTFLCDGTPVNGPIVTGTWNVIIDSQTPAQVTLNVFYNGGHHLAFGYNALMQVSFVNGIYVFSGLETPRRQRSIRRRIRRRSPGTSNSVSAAQTRTPTTR
jgi:hypothetical protein